MIGYATFDTWWWPYVFIAIAGWLATDMWRWIGVLVGNRLQQDSAALTWVRAVATALLAAVIAKLIIYPTGELANVPLALRIGAVTAGFAAFLMAGKRTWVGIVTALALLIGGQFLLG
ncbi:MAG: AzlD domain-containing protein [Hoeflea sp.]|uniref:AzlD domain-containing protein n=1 Tax=Hoeflea sp. TaxID=1940281 RepID=UPI001D59DD19|nr:AzlD domain-containing protein [Hoeflea sp.]MBU4529665.1 AzlD domain-containing protein [Alphaproteobacteria bacterium]MBU4546784.1 AzlD domain-containing protein [Alphaproteobacteria bacterium]MBU4551052.1 AzlD domain-containing protein [Alphaproteobacteria bacterium]MBV1723994.1 AzlD domain-containing protein [Hoeflea sp.]MBV1763271.1 AzlD domain-containing protein [Hoeflea sp.]